MIYSQLRNFFNSIPVLSTFLRNVRKKYYQATAMSQADKIYRMHFGRSIDWHQPVEFNEKIRYLQFKTDTAIWVNLADKYRVRDFIERKGYARILVRLFGVWTDEKQIEFEKLPDSFVLKINNGCGDVIVVNDKSRLNRLAVREQLKQNIRVTYGLKSAEPHYSQIKPCIIAEEKLENDADFSNCIVDYKFFCFHGEPLICGVFYDRIPNSHMTNSTFYDMAWHRHDEWRSDEIHIQSKDVPRPEKLEEMIEICRDLCRDIPFVRLDLYYVNKKIYFGEFTFTPAGCCGGSLNPNIFKWLGDCIKL